MYFTNIINFLNFSALVAYSYDVPSAADLANFNRLNPAPRLSPRLADLRALAPIGARGHF